MQYMLDTDIVSYVIRSRSPGLLATMQEKTHVAALSISVVTYAELRLGAERSRSARRLHEAIDAFCDRLHAVLPWDTTAADEFAKLQSRLLDAGTPIGANDAMIAAHARGLGCVLVTNNRKHFARVSGLIVENWAE